MSLAERVARGLRGEPVCGFVWGGTGGLCDGIPVGERDGKPACRLHLKPYVPTENRPYDEMVECPFCGDLVDESGHDCGAAKPEGAE